MIGIARIAEIIASKRTSDLVLCVIYCQSRGWKWISRWMRRRTACIADTGGDHWQYRGKMEALTAVQLGLLTIYDMCRTANRGIVIADVRVLEKDGGKSGLDGEVISGALVESEKIIAE